MIASKYYIVNCNRLNDIYYYGVTFDNVLQAQEAIDNYIGDGHYLIARGAFIKVLGISKFKSHFRKYTPEIYRRHRGTRREHSRIKRGRIKGQGIRVYRFKAVWEPYPEVYEKRKKFFKQHTHPIRSQILKG